MVTRSRGATPRASSALAAWQTLRCRSAYVMVRVSPGSPSQWMATRSPRPAATWRSTQLYATLSLPSANHFANGASDQSRVSLNGVDQESRLACLAQNASQSSSASRYSASPALACSANDAGGGYDDGPSVWVAVTGFLLMSRLVNRE